MTVITDCCENCWLTNMNNVPTTRVSLPVCSMYTGMDSKLASLDPCMFSARTLNTYDSPGARPRTMCDNEWHLNENNWKNYAKHYRYYNYYCCGKFTVLTVLPRPSRVPYYSALFLLLSWACIFISNGVGLARFRRPSGEKRSANVSRCSWRTVSVCSTYSYLCAYRSASVKATAWQ